MKYWRFDITLDSELVLDVYFRKGWGGYALKMAEIAKGGFLIGNTWFPAHRIQKIDYMGEN